MKAYLINMHLLVPRSRSSAKVKVKYKGYISQKMAVSGAFMFHKHILFVAENFYNHQKKTKFWGKNGSQCVSLSIRQSVAFFVPIANEPISRKLHINIHQQAKMCIFWHNCLARSFWGYSSPLV